MTVQPGVSSSAQVWQPEIVEEEFWAGFVAERGLPSSWKEVTNKTLHVSKVKITRFFIASSPNPITDLSARATHQGFFTDMTLFVLDECAD